MAVTEAAAAAAAATTTTAAGIKNARVVDVIAENVGDGEGATAAVEAVAARPSRCPYTHALVQYFAPCANSFRLFRFYFYCVCIISFVVFIFCYHGEIKL